MKLSLFSPTTGMWCYKLLVEHFFPKLSNEFVFVLYSFILETTMLLDKHEFLTFSWCPITMNFLNK